jgi:hypothetical protein
MVSSLDEGEIDERAGEFLRPGSVLRQECVICGENGKTGHLPPDFHRSHSYAFLSRNIRTTVYKYIICGTGLFLLHDLDRRFER